MPFPAKATQQSQMRRQGDIRGEAVWALVPNCRCHAVHPFVRTENADAMEELFGPTLCSSGRTKHQKLRIHNQAVITSISDAENRVL